MNIKLTLLHSFVAAGLGWGVAYGHGAVEPHGDSKKLQFYPSAQSMELPSMEEPGVLAYFDDIVSSGQAKAPIACGLFKIEQGNPLIYTYDYDDIKIMLEGTISFSDGEQTVTGNPGDVLFFPNGSTITFSTESSGLAFACGQRDLF